MDTIKHVVWDWNGTLLDDIDVSMDALNTILKKEKLPLVLDKAEYIVIGKPLISSQAFPPLHTVHATFTAHGVPSVSRFRCLNNQTCHRNTVLC